MSAASARYLTRVAALGCMLCRRLGYEDTPAEIHHAREGQGMQQRGSDWLAIPLCPDHHRGPHGIHGDRQELRHAKADEMDLLSDTIQALNP